MAGILGDLYSRFTGGTPGSAGLLGQLGGSYGQNVSDSSDSLMGFGMGMLSGATPQEGFGNALAGMTAGQNMALKHRLMAQQEAERAAKVEAAKAYAAKYPQYAGMLAANPDLAVKFAEAEQKKSLDPVDPLDAQLKQAHIDYYHKQAAGGNPTYGLQPIFGQRVNPQTGEPETVMLQAGNNGSVTEPKLPDGVKLATGVEKIDTGTATVLVDKRTGNVISSTPKDIAGKEVAEATGKAQGAAVVNTPDANATADRMLQQIDEVKNHPGKSWGTGMTSLGNGIPGTEQYAFQQRVDQLKGGTFLQSYNTLRGAGAITDIEGKKAEQAIARLNSGLSGREFDQALDDLKSVIQSGKERMNQKAAGNFTGGAPRSAAPAPKAGRTGSGVSWGVEP